MTSFLPKTAEGPGVWAGPLFRLARIFLLTLLVIMPWEAVTAAREIAMVGAAFFLAASIWLSPDHLFRPTVLVWPLAFYVFTAAEPFLGGGLFLLPAGTRAEILKGPYRVLRGRAFYPRPAPSAPGLGRLAGGRGHNDRGRPGVFLFIRRQPAYPYVRAGSLHNGYGGMGTYLALIWPFLFWPRWPLRTGPDSTPPCTY